MLKKKISLGLFLLYVATALAGGFFAGLIIGSNRITISHEDALLMKGALSQSYYELGKYQEIGGKHDEAKMNYTEAIKLNPRLAEVYPALEKIKRNPTGSH